MARTGLGRCHQRDHWGCAVYRRTRWPARFPDRTVCMAAAARRTGYYGGGVDRNGRPAHAALCQGYGVQRGGDPRAGRPSPWPHDPVAAVRSAVSGRRTAAGGIGAPGALSYVAAGDGRRHRRDCSCDLLCPALPHALRGHRALLRGPWADFRWLEHAAARIARAQAGRESGTAWHIGSRLGR